MTYAEAQQLQITGKYSELLRAAVDEQIRAAREGRAEDEVRWSIWCVKACRYVGRTVEGTAHAAHAVQKAEALGRRVLLAEAVYVQALLFKIAGRRLEGLASLDRAFELLPPDAPEIDRAVFELERAELALEAGRMDEARASLARGGAQVHWLENTRLLTWVLYLRALIDGEWTADMQLTASLAIARTIHCPELEWQILWRLAQRAGREMRPEAEREMAHHAISILRKMAGDLQAEDVPSFWRQGARASFVEYGCARFGPSFREHVVLAPASGPAERERLEWDPKLLPEFVRESLRATGGGSV